MYDTYATYIINYRPTSAHIDPATNKLIETPYQTVGFIHYNKTSAWENMQEIQDIMRRKGKPDGEYKIKCVVRL